MIWPSDRNQRDGEKGFVLLEALISFALVSLVLVAVFLAIFHGARSQRQRLDELYLTEFAYGKLEEWRMGGRAATSIEGRTDGGWNWRISEQPAVPDGPSSLDTIMAYLNVEAVVWSDKNPDHKLSFETLVARRKP